MRLVLIFLTLATLCNCGVRGDPQPPEGWNSESLTSSPTSSPSFLPSPTATPELKKIK